MNLIIIKFDKGEDGKNAEMIKRINAMSGVTRLCKTKSFLAGVNTKIDFFDTSSRSEKSIKRSIKSYEKVDIIDTAEFEEREWRYIGSTLSCVVTEVLGRNFNTRFTYGIDGEIFKVREVKSLEVFLSGHSFKSKREATLDLHGYLVAMLKTNKRKGIFQRSLKEINLVKLKIKEAKRQKDLR